MLEEDVGGGCCNRMLEKDVVYSWMEDVVGECWIKEDVGGGCCNKMLDGGCWRMMLGEDVGGGCWLKEDAGWRMLKENVR
jgi:hypothetical protein